MGAVLASALVSGSIYALIAAGFALAFRVSSVFNLSHGMLVISAGYLNYGLHAHFGLPSWASIPISIAVIGLFGFIVEAKLIPSARALGLKPVELLVVSWLLMLVIQDLVGILSENQSVYAGGAATEEGKVLFGGHITSLQMGLIAFAFAVGALFFILARSSELGRKILAVGDNPRLAQIFGLNVNRIIAVNSLIAATLTAAAGVALSYQQAMDASQGFRFSVVAIVATLVGGSRGPSSAIAAAYLVALLEATLIYLVDPRLRDAALYAFLFLILAVAYRNRPMPLTG